MDKRKQTSFQKTLHSYYVPFFLASVVLFSLECKLPENLDAPLLNAANTYTVDTLLLYKAAKAGDDSNIAYLVGNAVVGTKDMYPLPEYVENAFSSSDVLLTETPLPEYTENIVFDILEKIGKRNPLPDTVNYKIDTYIGNDLFTPLVKILQRNPVLYTRYYSILLDAEPAFANHLLKYIDPKWTTKDSIQPEYATERYLTKKAYANNKKVQHFETLEENLEIDFELPIPLQILLLTVSIDGFSYSTIDYTKSLRQYLAQDLQYYAKQLQEWKETNSLQAYYTTKVKKRNLAWAEKIDTLLSSTSTTLDEDSVYFVAVGIHHLAGTESLLALLQDMGYTISLLTPQ